MRNLFHETRKSLLDDWKQTATSSTERRTERFLFQGENQDLVVFKVPIEFPLYRIENGRTIRMQQRYLFDHPDQADTFLDPYSDIAQNAQEGILQQMVMEADLLQLLREEGQRDPLLLSDTGFVVNGNRRLTAMRMLNREGSTAGLFTHVDVVVLPPLEREEIQRIEMRLQMSQEGKASYNWVDELLVIHRSIHEEGMEIADVAKAMHKKPKTVRIMLRQLTLIDKYLETTGQSGQRWLVDNHLQAFKTLAEEHIKYEANPQKQLQLLTATFNILKYPTAGDSAYRYIKAAFADIDAIVPRADIERSESISQDSDSQSESDITRLLSRVGNKGGEVKVSAENAKSIYSSITNLKDKTEFDDIANAPLENVSRANTLLQQVRISESTTNRKPLRGQLGAIQKRAEELIQLLNELDRK